MEHETNWIYIGNECCGERQPGVKSKGMAEVEVLILVGGNFSGVGVNFSGVTCEKFHQNFSSIPHKQLECHTISWKPHDNANNTKKKVKRSCMHTSIFVLLSPSTPFLSSWILRTALHSRTPLPCLITSFGCLRDVEISFADGTTL